MGRSFLKGISIFGSHLFPFLSLDLECLLMENIFENGNVFKEKKW